MSVLSNMTVVGVIASIVFVVCMITFWPFAIIWALNTLFPLLSIPYSFFSWLAVCILNLSTFGGLSMSIRNNK